MTPNEAKAAMAEIYKSDYDEEGSHFAADELLCEILRELGYGEAVDIFNNATKWYA